MNWLKTSPGKQPAVCSLGVNLTLACNWPWQSCPSHRTQWWGSGRWGRNARRKPSPCVGPPAHSHNGTPLSEDLLPQFWAIWGYYTGTPHYTGWNEIFINQNNYTHALLMNPLSKLPQSMKDISQKQFFNNEARSLKNAFYNIQMNNTIDCNLFFSSVNMNWNPNQNHFKQPIKNV